MSVALLLIAAGSVASAQDTIEKRAKIVLLFDVSASMGAIDGPAKPGVDPAKLPSRQDHVLKLLHGGKFVEQLLTKAPVTAYRFGATLDDGDVAQFQDGKNWTAEQWRSWLTPLRAGTNTAGAAWQMLQREKDSYLQAIVIFSDGRSNHTTRAQIDAFLAAVRDLQPMAPVYTVGVGGFDMLPRIQIGDLHAPQEVRPGDVFPVRVPIHAGGLAGADFQVVLEARRIADGAGQPVAREKRYLPGPQAGTFKGDKAEHFATFDIDLKSLMKNAKESEIEGTWEFTARVPSHPREAFAAAEHVSAPVRVVVQNRRLRVLLFAAGPTREYQFLRTFLNREVSAKRMDLSIHLQSGSDDNIEPDRQLADFPNKLGANDEGKRFQSLNDYDVIVAFDPDWTKLSLKQRSLLKDWVGTHGGGIIFVAGPVNSYRIARPAGENLNDVLSIFPVVLKDSRLHGLGLPGGHDPTRPYALNFNPAIRQFPFLKSDSSLEGPTAGWNSFFWNNEKFKPEPAKDQRPKRGFFTYYPVERIKVNSITIATFAGPKETRIGDKTDAFKDQQPFMVTMPFGNGKSLYLGSGELWRLRAFKESYYERVWLGMIRHVAAETITQERHAQIFMPRYAIVGNVPIEVKIQAKDAKPIMHLRKLPADGVKLKPFTLDPVPKKAGWFADTIKIIEPGEYSVRISVGEDFVSHRLSVRKEAGELDDVRVDFGQLYQLASKAEPVLARLPEGTRKEIEARLRESAKFPGAPESQDVPWLFFRLADAGAIPACLKKLPAKKFKKVERPKALPDPDSEFKKEFAKKKPAVKVLVIDGDLGDVKEAGDTYCIERAITSIPKAPYKVEFGNKLAGADAVKALERDDLAKFGAIFLLNVRQLNAKQLANLEKYSQAGGGVAFFMGPNVNSAYYNKYLYKEGKGVFPVPLAAFCYPKLDEKELKDEDHDGYDLLLRDDLFPERSKYPIFGEIFDDPRQVELLKHLPIRRYFKTPRAEWRPEAGKSFELATLPNRQPATAFQKAVLDLVRGEPLKKIQKDDAFKNYRRDLERHRAAIEDLVRPGTENKAAHLVKAIDDMMLDPGMKGFWKRSDPDVRAVLEDFILLRQDARHGDPLIVGGRFGKGKVVAVLTSAGKQWTDFPGGCLASVIYQPFIWETLNYLTESDRPDQPKVNRVPGNARPPQLIGIDLAHEPRVLIKNPMKGRAKAEEIPKELANACLVTPDAAIRFRGLLADDAGLANAHWIVEVHPVEIKGQQFSKILAAQKTLHIPLEGLRAAQERRAYAELIHNVMAGSKDKTYPSGITTAHALADEGAFDFGQHLAQLKFKNGVWQDSFLVKISLSATSVDPKLGTSRIEKPFEFLVVSENELLVNILHQNEKVLDQLEKAQEKMMAIQSRLDEQIDRLGKPDADPQLIAPRVAQMRRSLQDSAKLFESAHQDADRMVRDMAMNRVKSQIKEKTARLADTLELSGFAKAEKSLSQLFESLENGKKDVLLKQAGAVRDDLKKLDKSIAASLDMLSEGMVEAQLIALLLAIEKEQRNSKKP